MEEHLLSAFYSGVGAAPLLVALVAGVLSFLSPCVLPLVPAYMSYISGVSLQEFKYAHSKRGLRLAIFARACGFVLGFGLVFVGLGLALSRAIFWLDSAVVNIIAGLVVLCFGVHFLGIYRIKLLYKTKRFDIVLRSRIFRILAPFLLGVSFALGWTPCTGPIFGAIALMAGTSGYGVILLVLYACGLAVPFLLLALVLERGFEFLDGLKKYMRAIEIIAGILLIIVGILIMSGNLSAISAWAMGS